jgi:hypothetical protein
VRFSTAQTPAPLGHFVNVTGAASATPAPEGRFVDVTGASASSPCVVGTFAGATGQSACTPAPPGTYVDITGSTAATPCGAGRYQANSAQATCNTAQIGFFAPGPTSTAQTPAPLGYFVFTTGANVATPAPPGHFVGVTGASASTPCLAGTFSAGTGASACTPAPAGSFVNVAAATSATPCGPGRYTSVEGQSLCEDTQVGFFAPGPTSTAPTPAPLGHFVAATGASGPTPAIAGRYVDTTGASASIPCAAGSYTGSTGSSSCTPAPAGSFAVGPGATSSMPCSLGRYSSTEGSTTCTPASAGYFVAVTGGTAQIPAAAGFFVGITGGTAQVPAPVGSYVAITAATAATPCPANSQSFGASVSCRDTGAGPSWPGPVFEYVVPLDGVQLPAVFSGTTSVIPVEVLNAASGYGPTSPLTRLTLLGLSGPSAFSAVGLTPGATLGEGGNYAFNVRAQTVRVGSFDEQFGVRTDVGARLGENGATFNRRVRVEVSGTDIALRGYAPTPYSLVGKPVVARLVASNNGDQAAPPLALSTADPAGLSCTWHLQGLTGSPVSTASLPAPGPLVDTVTLGGSEQIEYRADCTVLTDGRWTIDATIDAPAGDVDLANNQTAIVARDQLIPAAPPVTLEIESTTPGYLWMGQVRTWWRVTLRRIDVSTFGGANRLVIGAPFGIDKVQWGCTATGSATCPILPAAGTTQTLAVDAGMPMGSSMTFTVTGAITQYEGPPVTLTATAAYNDPADVSPEMLRVDSTLRTAFFGNGFE